MAEQAGSIERPEDVTPSLVARLRAGEGESGRLLHAAYHAPLLRYCQAYLGNREDAEDAVQEVFRKVLAVTDVPENFRAWVYRVARNHCLNMLRARVNRRDGGELPTASHMGGDATGDLTRLVRQERHERVRHLVNMLPSAQREALQLRYVEDLSRQEIAYVLDVPESVVKSRLFEGLQNLRKHESLAGEE